MKIVINACHGGFRLSDAAVLRYAELKGIKLYVSSDRFGGSTFSTVPPEEVISQDDFYALSMEERAASNAKYTEQHLSPYDIPRNDPLLVQVVEEMSGAASGRFSALKVVEIPDGVLWSIHDYDGCEHVEEQHRSWS